MSTQHGYFQQSFEVVKEIGSLVNGAVMACKRKETGDLVAVKYLDLEKKPMGFDILRWELLGMTEVAGHEHILRGYEVFEDGDRAFLVSELCDMDLYAVTENVELPPESAMIVFKKIADALLSLHASGISHRDIKLENVFVRAPRGMTIEAFEDPKLCNLIEIKLGDFGFWAYAKESGGQVKLLREACGSDVYGAYEQCLRPFAKHGYDGLKADVFSTGVVLFLLYLGFPPWESCQTITDPYWALWSSGMNHQYWRIVDHHTGGVSPAFKDLMSKMLHIDPNQRPTLAQVMTHPFVTGVGAENVHFKASNEGNVPSDLKEKLKTVLESLSKAD